MESSFKIFYRSELFPKEHFRFESSKEIFHDTVIQTVSLSRHTLSNSMVCQHLLIVSHLILPSLIRMQQRSRPSRKNRKQTIHHCFGLSKIRSFANRIRQDFRAKQIKDRRQIDFLITYGEFGNIRHL